ncbi:uncharacterized protein LOC144009970 isoform X5 [Festucalex cinctus]
MTTLTEKMKNGSDTWRSLAQLRWRKRGRCFCRCVWSGEGLRSGEPEGDSKPGECGEWRLRQVSGQARVRPEAEEEGPSSGQRARCREEPKEEEADPTPQLLCLHPHHQHADQFGGDGGPRGGAGAPARLGQSHDPRRHAPRHAARHTSGRPGASRPGGGGAGPGGAVIGRAAGRGRAGAALLGRRSLPKRRGVRRPGPGTAHAGAALPGRVAVRWFQGARSRGRRRSWLPASSHDYEAVQSSKAPIAGYQARGPFPVRQLHQQVFWRPDGGAFGSLLHAEKEAAGRLLPHGDVAATRSPAPVRARRGGAAEDQQAIGGRRRQPRPQAVQAGKPPERGRAQCRPDGRRNAGGRHGRREVTSRRVHLDER